MATKTIKIFGLILLAVVLIRCSNSKTENKAAEGIFVIDSNLPLDLDKIDLTKTDHLSPVDDEIVSKIQQTIIEYYKAECLNDDLSNYRDTYMSTIRLNSSLHTLYFVLLKNYPTGELCSKVLFYDNLKKEFLDPLDFKIYALYDFKDNKIKSSNLKSIYNIDTPDIELLDFDLDGIDDFKFTRLFHNGTFNSIHTTILTVKNSTLDTLDFKEQVIGQSN